MNINRKNEMDHDKSREEFVQSILHIFLSGESNLQSFVPKEAHKQFTDVLATRTAEILYPMLMINTHNKVIERYGKMVIDEERSGNLSKENINTVCDACFRNIPKNSEYWKCETCDSQRCILYSQAICSDCEGRGMKCWTHGENEKMIKHMTGDNSVTVVVDEEIYNVHFAKATSPEDASSSSSPTVEEDDDCCPGGICVRPEPGEITCGCDSGCENCADPPRSAA